MKNRKMYQFLFCAVLSILSINNYAEESRKYFIGAESLNVRKEPSVTSDSLFLLKKRTPVEVVEITGNYDRIDGIISPWLRLSRWTGKPDLYSAVMFIRKILQSMKKTVNWNIMNSEHLKKILIKKYI